MPPRMFAPHRNNDQILGMSDASLSRRHCGKGPDHAVRQRIGRRRVALVRGLAAVAPIWGSLGPHSKQHIAA
jgi:hypothetical protein